MDLTPAQVEGCESCSALLEPRRGPGDHGEAHRKALRELLGALGAETSWCNAAPVLGDRRLRELLGALGAETPSPGSFGAWHDPLRELLGALGAET